MKGYALVNCTVYSPREKYEGVAICFNRVVKVGSENEVRRVARALGLKIYDLKGAVVLPGFIDSHMHLAGLGFSLSLVELDLRNVYSIAELKAIVAKEASRKPRGHWIIGRGWDQEKFAERRYPSRWDLDEVAPHHPVFLKRICGHVAVVNSLALKLAGITRDTPDPLGGKIDRDDRGEPTGIIRESALRPIYSIIEQENEDYENAVLRAAFQLVSQGVTCVGAVSCDIEELKALFRLAKKDVLPLRVRTYLRYSSFAEVKDVLPVDFSLKNVSIAGVKILLDGSLGARTAFLREPYSDDQSTRGVPVVKPEELKEMLKTVSRYGWQPAVHAIGDAALELYLKILKEIGHVNRPRVEHASVTPPDLLEEMRELDVVPVVQPHFVISDFWIIDRLGERAKYVYLFKTMIKKGLKVAFSTDAPVEPSDPLETIHAAVTRGEGLVKLFEITPGEKLSIREALEAYTIGSSLACRLENMCGTIREGSLADIVVLNRDPYKVNLSELKNIRVLATIVDGRVVYGTLNLKHP